MNMVKLFSFAFGFGVVDGMRRSEVSDLDITAEVCPIVGSKREPNMAGQSRSVETDWQGCQSRCAGTPGCVYFSHYPDGVCYLHDKSAKFYWSWTATSGPVSCPLTTVTTTAVPTTTTTTTTSINTIENVDSLTNWFESMEGGHMMRGARDRAVRETTDNPDLDVAKLKSLSGFFQTMAGGHHIRAGEATDMALKELKAQPALDVDLLKELTAYYRSQSGGWMIRTGQASNTALTYLRNDYGPFLLVSEVKSLGIDKAIAEAITRLEDSTTTTTTVTQEWNGVGRRFFPQKIGRQRVCIQGLKIRDLFTCQYEVHGVLTDLTWTEAGVWDDRPTGCIRNAAGEVFYNAHDFGAWKPEYGLICQRPKPNTVLCNCHAEQKTYKCEGHPYYSGKCNNKWDCTRSGSWYFPAMGLRAAGICT